MFVMKCKHLPQEHHFFQRHRVRAAVCSRNRGHKSSALTSTPIHVTVAKFSPGAMSMMTLPREHNEHRHCPLHTGLSEAGEAHWGGTQIGSVGKTPKDFP